MIMVDPGQRAGVFLLRRKFAAAPFSILRDGSRNWRCADLLRMKGAAVAKEKLFILRSPPWGGRHEGSAKRADPAHSGIVAQDLLAHAVTPISHPMADFDTIRDDFEFLDDWDDRYKYLIDLGRTLAPYPDTVRDEAHKVKGCASQVWLHATRDDDVITFEGDSDAHIVKGLVALLIALYSGKSPEDITQLDPAAALKPFDLDDHLTPQRSNGLHSMVKRIRDIAANSPRC